MSSVAKSKRGRNFKKATLPGISWTIKEKLDVVIGILGDERFTHGEKVVAATLVLYFHNTQTGVLHCSRKQISHICGATRDTCIRATRKMRRFDYVHYDESDGGCNHHISYHLRKLSVENSDTQVSKNQTPRVENLDTRVSKNQTRNYPLVDTTEKKEEGEASPSPCNSRASASPEKKKEAFKEEPVIIHLPNPQPPAPSEGPTQEERDRDLANWDRIKRQMKGQQR